MNPVGRHTHLKRVSLLIQSKKYPDQVFVGYALLHEFNATRLSFFTAQKFPVDDVLEVDMDFFGGKAHMKVRMVNIHEQISSGRVMNEVPTEANPFPVRKFYRCYAVINSLIGQLPGMLEPVGEEQKPAADGSAAAPADAPAEAAPVAAAPVEGEPPVANAGDSLVTPSDKPADSAEMAAKLAAVSAPAEEQADEKQAA